MQNGSASDPLISIIIPCYNASKFIKETLNSIFNQEIKNIEIILIDDGSTDNTVEVIKDYIHLLKYVYHKNQGVSISRNKGLDLAKGEYVIFFDADDLMTKDFLKDRLNILNNNIKVQFTCGILYLINEKGKLLENKIYYGYSEKIILDILLYNKSVTTCPSNYLIRKIFLIKNKIYFNENLSSVADKIFLCKLAFNGEGFQIKRPESALLYRKHSLNMSGKNNYAHLVYESERLIEEVKDNNYFGLDLEASRNFLLKNYFLLFKAFFKINKYSLGLPYLLKYLKLKTVNVK